MAQIAQQDHLYVDIANISSLTTDEKKVLWNKHLNYNLLDVVLRWTASNIEHNAKVVEISYKASDTTLTIYYSKGGTLSSIAFTNPFAA